jgi:1,4-dihydroxy-6-naphthoate synthase
MSFIIKLGFSPCPNDTFIFDALINKKIDTEGIDFICEAEDIEQLNLRVMDEDLDMAKVSFHAFLHLAPKYQLLDAGSALGSNCGPLLISKKEYTPDEINELEIGIPGKYTTATLLLKYAFPLAKKLFEFRFNHIENKILKNHVDAGVIIHESRFTYQDKGLIKLADLGEIWEQNTGFPIPLGGIIVKRDMPEELKARLNQIMHASVEYAMQNPDASAEFIREHATELDEEVIRKHIELYVNHYTKSLGGAGKDAIRFLFDYALENKIIDKIPAGLFVEEFL